MIEPLWTSAECAEFFNRSQDRFWSDIAAVPGFPTPIVLPTGKSRSSRPLWVPDEVRDWAMLYKKKAA